MVSQPPLKHQKPLDLIKKKGNKMSTYSYMHHWIIRWKFFFIFKLLILGSWQTELSVSEAVTSQRKNPRMAGKAHACPYRLDQGSSSAQKTTQNRTATRVSTESVSGAFSSGPCLSLGRAHTVSASQTKLHVLPFVQ